MLVIGLLLASLVHLRRRDYSILSNHMAKRTRENLQLLKPCPLCGELLKPGERVHTIVFSGEPEGRRLRDRERPADSMVHMFGCPYCYPANGNHRRICPVCKEELADDGYVIARMFEKRPRNHVHVLGCTRCRTGRPDR